jgi:toxin ParE1/3/4
VTRERTVSVHPSAAAEARAAHGYYASHSKQAGSAFLRELDLAIVAITESPHRWRVHAHGTRRYLLRRFPFLVIYLEVDQDTLVVVAVAHARRRPDYWHGRVRQTT